ncbi:MAG TPA: hypothetical protein VFL86_15300 [Burkholderiaceae bacterium]|nr:hypothetical protein [Burkholderiaceae bacterium]
MPSSRTSISNATRSASNGGGGSVHADIAAASALPSNRYSTRLTQPAGLESLNARHSLRESRAGAGIGDRSRSVSLPYGVAAQPAGSSSHSGAWRESLVARNGSSGAKPAGQATAESERQSVTDPGIGHVSRSISQQHGLPAQAAGSSGHAEARQESLRADSGSEGGGGSAQKAPSIGSSFGIRRDHEGVGWYDHVNDQPVDYSEAYYLQVTRQARAASEKNRQGKESAVAYYPKNWGDGSSGATARYRYDSLNDCVWDTKNGKSEELDPDMWRKMTKEEASLCGRSGKLYGSDHSKRFAEYRERNPLTEEEKQMREAVMELGPGRLFG